MKAYAKHFFNGQFEALCLPVVSLLSLITQMFVHRCSAKEQLNTQQEVSSSLQINTQSGKSAVLENWNLQQNPQPGSPTRSRSPAGFYGGLAALLPTAARVSCSAHNSLINETILVLMVRCYYQQLVGFPPAVRAGQPWTQLATHMQNQRVCESEGNSWNGGGRARADHPSAVRDRRRLQA